MVLPFRVLANTNELLGVVLISVFVCFLLVAALEMTGPSYPITTHPSAWDHANPQPPLPAPQQQAPNFAAGPPPPRSDNPRFDNAMRGSGPPRRDFAQEQGDTGRRGAGHEKWRMEAPENRDPGRRLIGCGERELRWRREGSGRFGDHRGSGGYGMCHSAPACFLDRFSLSLHVYDCLREEQPP